MERNKWKRKIKKATIEAGTYRPFFDSVIDTLAGILERRDIAEVQFEESGGEVMIDHENKGGGVYKEKNPALTIINELNRDALAYWRDLGLTPAGLKKINETELKKKKKESALESALRSLGG